MAEEKKDIGALWVRSNKDGMEYMTGTITIGEVAHEIVLFSNKYRTAENKQPHWRIYPSRPRAEAVEEPTVQVDEFPF